MIGDGKDKALYFTRSTNEGFSDKPLLGKVALSDDGSVDDKLLTS